MGLPAFLRRTPRRPVRAGPYVPAPVFSRPAPKLRSACLPGFVPAGFVLRSSVRLLPHFFPAHPFVSWPVPRRFLSGAPRISSNVPNPAEGRHPPGPSDPSKGRLTRAAFPFASGLPWGFHPPRLSTKPQTLPPGPASGIRSASSDRFVRFADFWPPPDPAHRSGWFLGWFAEPVPCFFQLFQFLFPDCVGFCLFFLPLPGVRFLLPSGIRLSNRIVCRIPARIACFPAPPCCQFFPRLFNLLSEIGNLAADLKLLFLRPG